MPTRTANGLFLKRPQVALDLYYLLSFQGSDLDLQSQQLLGSAVITLHTQPILLPSIIRNTTQANTYLAQSDLFDQIELVKFGPLNLSLDELSKLWSVLFQVPYILSIAYKAAVVLIEANVTPIALKPVLERDICVTPEVVVFGGRDKLVHCVKRDTGQAVWSFPTRGKVDSSPAICGKKVIVGSDDGRLYLVSLDNGKELWSYEVGQPIGSSPAVAREKIVVGCDDGNVYCFGGK